MAGKHSILAVGRLSSSDLARTFIPKANLAADFEFSGWFTWNLGAARPKDSTSIRKAPEQEAFSGAVSLGEEELAGDFRPLLVRNRVG